MVMLLRAQVHFFAAARTEARTRTDILGEVKLSAHYRMTIRFLPFSCSLEIFGEGPVRKREREWNSRTGLLDKKCDSAYHS